MNICQNCSHFHQHYILDKQRATAVSCGHCAHPRLKHRRPEDKACAHFEAGAHPLPHREEIVDYLTREFLEYITTLTLPPEQFK